jgi:hypothetical protein
MGNQRIPQQQTIILHGKNKFILLDLNRVSKGVLSTSSELSKIRYLCLPQVIDAPLRYSTVVFLIL